MFRINKYEITEKDNVQHLKLSYTYLGKESATFIPKILDGIFGTMAYHAQKISLEPGHNYWTVFRADSHGVGNNILSNFSFGFVFQMLSEERKVMYSENIPFVITDYKKRSFMGSASYALPNFWLIGASMTGYMVRDLKPSQFITGRYVITPAAHLALSLNRFMKRDYAKYLQSLPIKPNDTLGLFLGGTDLNVAIIRNAKLKGTTPQHLLNKILFKYIGVINNIKSLYPECKIVIIPTNLVIPDSHSVSNKDVLMGSQELRRELSDQFIEFFNQEIKNGLMDYFWDCMNVYLDEDRYCKPEFLIEDDHHIGDGTLFIEKLKEEIDKNKLY